MQISQYLCSRCGSVLKETSEYIDIYSLREECPRCGNILAESLERKSLQLTPRLDTSKLHRADSLLKLRFDISRLDSFMGLAANDLCCITGYQSDLILTRLCIRSLLPERYGGPNSPFSMIADTGNLTDAYSAINFARQYGINKENAADRILIIRAFTVSQVYKLLAVELPKLIKTNQIKNAVILGLLNVIDEDQNMRVKEARKEIRRFMKAITDLSNKMLVVTSIQESKYSNWVLPDFRKRINIINEKHGRLTVQLYNQGRTRSVSLGKNELKIISRK